jgi:hypothetical protein
MDRRGFLKLSGSAAILGLGFTAIERRPVWAQGTTSLAGLGLPELTVTLTEAGFQVSPSETASSWTLVTFTNTLPESNDDGPDFMLIPAGQTIDDILNLAATPTAGPPPVWAYETTFAGGPFVGAGKTAQAVVNLTVGDWMVWSAGEPQYAATLLTVTAPGSASPAPLSLTADVEVTLQEYAFVGLDKPVPAGQRVWKVTNGGAQPHIMILGKLPDGSTTEQLLASLMAMMTGTPIADTIDLTNTPTVGGCSTLSVGQTLYLPLDLAAGTYAAVCFFPDQQTGAPHVLMGMATAFTVA